MVSLAKLWGSITRNSQLELHGPNWTYPASPMVVSTCFDKYISNNRHSALVVAWSIYDVGRNAYLRNGGLSFSVHYQSTIPEFRNFLARIQDETGQLRGDYSQFLHDSDQEHIMDITDTIVASTSDPDTRLRFSFDLSAAVALRHEIIHAP